MRFLSVSFQHFRNIGFSQINLDAKRIFFLGDNGQGKTNALEALGLVTALRSFRTQNTDTLIQQGHATGGLFFRIKKGNDEETVQLTLSKGNKSLLLNEQPVKRFAEYIGQFPVVILSANDSDIVRDGPSVRRRFLDLTLSAMNPKYFTLLRDYHKAVADRNELLKSNGSDAQLSAFEQAMLPSAEYIYSQRKTFLLWLTAKLHHCYRAICPSELFDTAIQYNPSIKETSSDNILSKWKADRQRDRLMKSTQNGPHRDDFTIQLGSLPARDCASEGQQRTLAVALRLAQLKYYQQQSKEAPVLLIDDIVGELDSARRKAFWHMLPDIQVIATGTALPQDDSENWFIYHVSSGQFAKE